ncbi:MAG: FG-GAP repeat protein [Flavobacteriales bacterium]|nr:FG-GAP repeat protein [Flavobacteriales bacterium]
MRKTAALLLMHVIPFGATFGQYWPEEIVPPPLSVTANGRFGHSIALQDNWLLVGAPGVDAGVPGSGLAYLFDRNEGGVDAWDLVKTLYPPFPAFDAGFGTRVELFGDHAFVAAPTDTYLGYPVGSVCVFQRDLGGPGNWGFLQKIQLDTLQADLAFGAAMYLSEGYALIACPGYDEDPGGQEGLGAVVLFSLNSAGLFEQTRFIRGDALVDTVTFRPCIAGELTVVQNTFVHARNDGIYSLNADSVLDATLPLPVATRSMLTDTFGQPANSTFFRQVLGSQELAVIGVVPYDQSVFPRMVSFTVDAQHQLTQGGHAIPDTSLSQLEYHEYSWGRAADLEGHRLIVGAYGDEIFTPLGHAEVFDHAPGSLTGWERQAYLVQPDPALGDLFGWSVTIADDVVAVGAPTAGGTDEGKVYVFRDPFATVNAPPDATAPGFTIAPDPISRAEGVLRIDLGPRNGAGTATIRNVRGHVIAHHALQGSGTLPVHGLLPGIYVLEWDPAEPHLQREAQRFVVMP